MVPLVILVRSSGRAWVSLSLTTVRGKRGCSYVVLWNAFKRIAADYTPEEKRDLFHDTAARAYRIPTGWAQPAPCWGL